MGLEASIEIKGTLEYEDGAKDVAISVKLDSVHYKYSVQGPSLDPGSYVSFHIEGHTNDFPIKHSDIEKE